jgi:hypothetical protein
MNIFMKWKDNNTNITKLTIYFDRPTNQIQVATESYVTSQHDPIRPATLYVRLIREYLYLGLTFADRHLNNQVSLQGFLTNWPGLHTSSTSPILSR